VNHLAVRGRGRAATAIVLGAELVVAVLAVSTAATMVTIQPASARQPVLTGLPTTAAHHFGEADAVRVHLTLNPPAPEAQGFQVTVGDVATGVPLEDVQRVYLTLAGPPDAAIRDQRIELAADSGIAGLYAARGPYTPVEGDWQIGVVVRRAGVRDETVEFDVPIRRQADPELAPPPDTGIGVPAPMALAWSLLPRGLAAWLPAGLAMAALVAMTRVRADARMAFIVRAVLTTIVVIGGLAAGSRALVDAANAPTQPELAAIGATRPEPDVDAAERGQRLYAANCAACHGADGAGDGPIATMPRPVPLADAVPAASDAELAYRIVHGVAGTPMPPFAGRLSEEERWDVVAYLRSRWDAE
jgi:mono/diheme cytochrome c family protein